MTPRGSHPHATRFERSARFWLRAYPRRWRAARGEEVLGVLLDLAAPGERRVGARTALDLVRGGWATRLRGRPPLLPWLGYALLGRRIPTPYRAWAKDDIESPFGAVWAVLMFFLLAWVMVPWVNIYRDPPFVGLMIAAMTLGQATSARRRRFELSERHLVPRPGEVVHAGQLVVQAVPRRRVAALAVLPSIIGALAIVLVASGVALMAAETAVVVATAAVVGLAGAASVAAVASRRLRRVATLRVEQPARDLQGADGLGWVRLAVWTTAGLGLAVLEAAAWRQLPVIAVLLTLVAAGLSLAVTGLVATRRLPAPGEVALADLWFVLRHDMTVPVDEPVAGFAPMPGTVREGLVVPPRVLGGPRFPALPV